MKATLIGIYLTISIVCGVSFWLFGNYSYKGPAYNLGRGLVWPINVLRDDTEIDSTNDASFATTYYRVQAEHSDYEGRYLFTEAAAKILASIYAKQSPGFSYENYISLESGSRAGWVHAKDMFASMLKNNRDSVREFRNIVDGMEFIDVINAGEDADAETKELLLKRREEALSASSIDSCVDDKIEAYRSEAGQEALIRYDILGEWEQECAS